MMNTIYYWRDIYGDLSQFEPYMPLLQRFIDGERAGLHFEKLRTPSEPAIYSIRANLSTRILLSHYRNSLLLLDVVHNHDYEKSHFLRNPKKVQDFIHTDLDLKTIAWESVLEIPLTPAPSATFKAIDYYQRQIIQLSSEQERVISTPLPAIVIGPAGSGKTSSIFSLLIEQAKTTEGQIAYISQSLALVNTLKTMWQENFPDCNKVVFLSYAEVYPDTTTPSSFTEWLASHPLSGAGSALTPSQIWQEFRIRSGCNDDTSYLELGKRQSQIDSKERPNILVLFQKYNKHIRNHPELTCFSHTLPYTFIIIDEAQDLSHAQLKSLYQGSNTQVLFLLGSHQILFDISSKLDYIKSLIHPAEVPIISLPISYRSGENIIQLINRLIQLKMNVVGGGADKFETLMSVAEERKDQGQFELRPTENIKDLQDENPNRAIITLEHLKAEARERFATPLVFSIAEIKGLEFHTVVLWKLLSEGKAIDIANRISLSPDAGGHRPKFGQAHLEYLNIFDHWITAASRAQQHLIWCDDKRHKIAALYHYLETSSAKGQVEILEPVNWQTRFNSLMQHGAFEQARAIYIKKLKGSTHDFAQLIAPKLKTVDPNEQAYQNLKILLAQPKKQKLSHIYFQPLGKTLLLYILGQDEGLEVFLALHQTYPKSLLTMVPIELWFKPTRTNGSNLLQYLYSKIPDWVIYFLNEKITEIPDEAFNPNAKTCLIDLLMQSPSGQNLIIRIYNRKPNYLAKIDNPDSLTARVLNCLLTHRLDINKDLQKKISKIRLKFPLEHCHEFANTAQLALTEINTWVLRYLALWGIAQQKILEGDESLVYQAIITNNLNLIHLFQQTGVDMNQACINDLSPLHAAILHNQLAIIQYLNEIDVALNTRLNTGATPLYCAAEVGNPDVIQSLLKHGADANIPNNEGSLPLHFAAEKGHLKALKLICRVTRNINEVGVNSETTLFIATLRGYTDIVQYLLESGADANLANKQGILPLHLAAKKGHQEILKQLIPVTKNINSVSNYGCTALFTAALTNETQNIEYLLASGADANISNSQSFLPLHLAAEYGHLQTLKLLCAATSNINSLGLDNQTALFFATLNQHYDVVEYLLESGADANIPNNEGFLPLHLAAEYGHLQTLKLLCAATSNINSLGIENESALSFAALGGHDDIVQYLLEHGADANIGNSQGFLPLHLAADKGHLKTLILLCAATSNINSLGINNETALFFAALRGHTEVVQYLLEHGADANISNKEGFLPLHNSAEKGHLDILKLLTPVTNNINSISNHGSTPLFSATLTGETQNIEYLLAHGADANIADKQGFLPLHLAAEKGYLEACEQLSIATADINSVTDGNLTSLYYATIKGHTEIIKYLLKLGVDANIADKQGFLPLHLAAETGNLEACEQLSIATADINSVTAGGVTTLFYATLKGQTDIIKYLLKFGADANITDINGSLPLHAAASFGDIEILKLFIPVTNNINSVDSYGFTALHCAAQNGLIRTVQYLLEQGSDPNIADKQGLLALHLAAEKGHLTQIKQLCKKTTDINSVGIENQTALSLASREGHTDVVEYLLEQGADPNIANNQGLLPLHLAAEKGHLAQIQLLCKKTTDINSVGIENQTALSLASREGHTDVIQYLLEHGAGSPLANLAPHVAHPSLLTPLSLFITKWQVPTSKDSSMALQKK